MTVTKFGYELNHTTEFIDLRPYLPPKNSEVLEDSVPEFLWRFDYRRRARDLRGRSEDV